MSRVPRTSSERLALFGVLVLAAVLRFWWIADGWFGVDQARDIAWGHAIASAQDFPLVGPLMRGRVHLGATYYYFWALPALLSSDALAPYVFASLLGMAAVWMTYRLGRELAGPFVGIAAAILFATMPIAVIDTRVAWAPAALPPLVAAVLLAGSAFLRQPTPSRAMLVLVLPSLGTQLHLAAAPLVPIGAALVLARWRAVGWRRTTLAAAAALVPLIPMAFAYYLDSGPPARLRGDTRQLGPSLGQSENPVEPAPVRAHDLRAGRLTDMLAASGRVLDAVNAPAGERPRLANAWIALERAWTPIALLAAIACLGLALTSRRPSNDAVGLVASTFIICVLVVAVLPAEAWYYYLDTTLVPAALMLALVLRPDRSHLTALVLAGVALLRAIGLLWWIASSHSNGFMRANLDLLRLGGSDPDASAGRSRLLTVRVKEQAADVLLSDLAIPLHDLWRRVHGAGFADLDGDNGFFFQRAATRASQGNDPIGGSADEALVVYASTFPDTWARGFSAPRRVGPLVIYRYAPSLRAAEATIESCGAAPIPARPIPDPRDYFFGQPPYPVWPCRNAVVRAVVDPPPDRHQVRVFARGLGAARVISITAEPSGTSIDDAPPGAGEGLLLAPGPAVMRVALAVDGPAALDLYEIHGEPGDGPERR